MQMQDEMPGVAWHMPGMRNCYGSHRLTQAILGWLAAPVPWHPRQHGHPGLGWLAAHVHCHMHALCWPQRDQQLHLRCGAGPQLQQSTHRGRRWVWGACNTAKQPVDQGQHKGSGATQGQYAQLPPAPPHPHSKECIISFFTQGSTCCTCCTGAWGWGLEAEEGHRERTKRRQPGRPSQLLRLQAAASVDPHPTTDAPHVHSPLHRKTAAC